MRLTPLKMRIYRAVKRAGSDGIDLTSVMGSERSRDCIKAHVWQINRRLRGERIVGTRGGQRDITGEWPYRLVKT